jgi:Protein of unknown function (DUF3396)
MKPSEGLSEELVRAVLGLDELMQVTEKKEVVCTIGLSATFYFLNGADASVRARVVRAFERYQSAVGPSLVWGADPKTGTAKKLAGTQIADLASWVPLLDAQEELDASFHGGKGKYDASPYVVTILARARRPTELSYFRFGLPLAWVAAHKPAAFTELVLDICKLLEPSSGYAGLAVIPHVNADRPDRGFEVALGFAARFRGLEIDLPGSHAIYMEQKDRIKGINWLTILDESWVAKLGGAEILRAQLGPDIRVHDYPKGIVIQAGSEPRFGDVHRQEPMPAYHEVALALAPIRIDSVMSLSSPFGFDRARSDSWLRRFD